MTKYKLTAETIFIIENTRLIGSYQCYQRYPQNATHTYSQHFERLLQFCRFSHMHDPQKQEIPHFIYNLLDKICIFKSYLQPYRERSFNLMPPFCFSLSKLLAGELVILLVILLLAYLESLKFCLLRHQFAGLMEALFFPAQSTVTLFSDQIDMVILSPTFS